MANPFDDFDTPSAGGVATATPPTPPAPAKPQANPFDSFDAPKNPFDSFDAPKNPFDSFDAPKNPFDSFDAPKNPFDSFDQPAAPRVTAEQLAQKPHGEIFAHAAQNPDDFETAYQADKLRRERPFMAKAGEFISNIPSGIVQGAKGVGNFIGGALQLPFHAAQQAYYGATGDPRQLTAQAENTLAAQHGEGAPTHIAETAGRALDAIDPSTWLYDTPKMKEEEGRRLFTQRVQQAKNELQLAQGRPLDTGAIASIYHAAGQQPSEEVGPEALKGAGVSPADQGTVNRLAAVSDPTMLALAAAPQLPGAAAIGGGATELAGKAIGGIGKGISATSKALGPLNVARRILNPTSIATDAAKEGGARGLSALGDILEQQGKELRTGAPSPLTTKAATAAATGEGALGVNAQRAIGDAAAKGAATAAGMAPLNAALSEGDPEALAQTTAGAGVFGGALGAFARNRPQMVEALRPHLQSEGARALAEAGEGNDTLAQKSAAYVMSLPEEARNRTLETIGALQGLPTDTPNGQTGAKVYVLNDSDYRQVLADKFGQQQAAMGGGRGFYIGDDGAAYVNGDYHSGLDPSELSHTVGHEFGGHAAINIMRASGAKGGSLYDGLMKSVRDAIAPNGKISPQLYRFAAEYNQRFDPSGETKRLDLSTPEGKQEALEEWISEQAGQLISGKGAGEVALPKNVQDRINDGVGRFMGGLLGADTRKVGTETHFGREEVGAISKAVQDTLEQVVGMKLRGGQEIPEAPKTDTTRIAELNQVLATPRPPAGTPVTQVHQWIREQRAARTELNQLQEGLGPQTPATGPAPKAPSAPAIISPPDVTADALKALSVMGIKGPKANALIRVANAQHGEPITDSGKLAAAAFRIHGGGNVKPGEFAPKPQVPVEPVPVPTGDKATFRDELGNTHTVTGAATGAPRVGDIVATREGEIRRITSIKGDTVDTARPIDPLNTRGNKTHKLSDIQPLDHDYAPTPEVTPGTPEVTKPTLGVLKRGDADFIVVDAAGNPVDKQSFATESAANQSIARRGKASTFGIPPSANGSDIIDTITNEIEKINLSRFTKEEQEQMFPHRGIWKNTLIDNVNGKEPDKVAAALAPSEHKEAAGEASHGNGDMRTMFDEITKAIEARNNLRDQQDAEEKRIAAEKKAGKGSAPNEPAEPTTEPTGTNNLPPEPTGTTLVSAEPTAAEEPAPLQASDVDQIAAQAEQAVVAARAGTRKKAHTLPKEVSDAQVDAVAAAHEQSVPANYQGVKLRRDALGKQTISGTFNPARPFDAFLLKLADLSPKAVGILQNLQSKIGQTVTINYGHAPHEEGPVIASGRREAQDKSKAQDRASGTAEVQNEDKNIVPLAVQFNKGTDSPSITIVGASPEKLLNNFNLATKAVQELGGEVPYSGVHDPHYVMDMKQLTQNHKNGFTYDGRRIEGFPDVSIPDAEDGFKPHVIPKDRFEFLNLTLGDESAQTGAKGASPTQKLKQGLAAKNAIAMTPEGEVNGLRAAINYAKGPVTDAQGKQTTWSKAHIENPLSEALRVDLVNEVHPEVKNEDASIRPNGYAGDISRFFGEGSPDRTFTASGFMPDTGRPSAVLSKQDERAGYKLFNVNPDKLDAGWKKDPMYVGPDFEGGIKGRKEGIQDWLQKNPSKPMEAASVTVDPDGTISFSNGRHRTRLLMEQGASAIPLAIDPDSIQNARANGLIPTSKEAAMQRIAARTAPDKSGNFMPDTGAPKTAKERAKERIAAREGLPNSANEPERPNFKDAAKARLAGGKPATGSFMPTETMRDDMRDQAGWLQSEARSRGYQSTDEMLAADPGELNKLSARWRVLHPRDEQGFLSQNEASRGINSTLYGDQNSDSTRPIAGTREAFRDAASHIGGGEQAGRSPAEQAGNLRTYAQENELAFSDLPSQFEPGSENDKGGMEHHVWFDPKSGRWIKATIGTGEGMGMVPAVNPDGGWQLKRGSVKDYLESRDLWNKTFGDDIRMHGVWDDGKNVSVVTSQPDISGDPMTAHEIMKAMESAGFTAMGDSVYYRKRDNVAVFDMHEGNAVNAGGVMIPFDGVILHPSEDLIDSIKWEKATGKSKMPVDESAPKPDFMNAARARFMPDTNKPTPEEEAAPEGTAPSGSPPNLPATGGTSKDDSVTPELGETPGERLMREAEQAGLAPSIEVIKGVLKGDQQAYEKLRKMVADRLGRPGRFLPSTRQSPKEAAQARIASRMAA